ncbi:MAG: zinc ribbon domain-containing protein, partial [Undibacterium sp.]|nr:zinc ribbon domain-containing protein [Undibacterium sp.]
LKSFGETRSMVVAPTSTEDMARAQQVGVMSHLLGGAHADAKNTLLTAALGAIAAPASATTTEPSIEKQRFCAHCGAPAAHDARFCGKCGTALAA